jgi:hypothetical protein
MRILTILTMAACLGAVLHADNMVFDRGLPVINLNTADSSRSNVAWGDNPTPSSGFNWGYGDDFKFGVSGQSYQITDLRVWIVGNAVGDPLSTALSSLTLAGGLPGTTTSSSAACSSSTLTGGPCLDGSGIATKSTGSTSGDPNVKITAVTYADGSNYLNNSGGQNQLYQVDFLNLNWMVQGDTSYAFFVLGVNGTPGNGTVSPYLSASNAAQSGSPQDGADGLIWEFAQDSSNSSNNAMDQWNSLGNGWDKPSDINVQIFATPEPSSILFLGTVVFFVGSLARRKYQHKG